MYNNKSKSIKRVFHLKSTFILAHCWHAGLQPAIMKSTEHRSYYNKREPTAERCVPHGK